MTDRGKRQLFEGRVLSDKMAKTAMVEVVRRVRHPVYKKYIVKKRKYPVHVTDGHACKVGDWVRFISCRPLSKTKRFRLIKVLKKANVE